MRSIARVWCAVFVLITVLGVGAAPASAQDAQEAGSVEGATAITGEVGDSALDHWWLGGYFRHLWVPSYITEPFFDRAPSVTNNGFGLVATYRTEGSLNIEMGVGYMPYEFNGTFLADNQPITDTEIVQSDLAFVHLTGSMMWDIEFHRTVALEIGFGIDLGVLTGDVRRDEAYLDPATGEFGRCIGPLNPNYTAQVTVAGQQQTRLYCDTPENGGATDPPEDEGEQYGVIEDRIPPVMLFPMIPHLAFRVQPFKYLTLKAEFGFGIVQAWVGLSLHGSFGLFEAGPTEIFVEPDEERVAMGRVLGRVVEAGTDVPVAGATVTVSGRALSPLSTLDDGRFVVDRLDAGRVSFEVSHPGFAPGTCSAEIPPSGGDAPVICHMTPRARVGAISGSVRTEGGEPVQTTVEITGPRNQTIESDEDGIFAALDVPEGTYRVRVDADGYLLQVLEVEVAAQDTAMPQVILVPQPKRSLVTLKKKEIVIAQQVQFKSGSAKILDESEGLMREIADVLLRNPQIELVEIQGHTDNTGSRSLNMELSQKRAEAVRDWLVDAGVEADRLKAKGYGPDHPIRANNTPGNRAKNRRVQFIIRRQGVSVDE
ncbi:MAG: OmpA family protein [Myxococcales bacterium]|jgi:outer membrane protein OmpA-like peptidoglycan-associated protein